MPVLGADEATGHRRALEIHRRLGSKGGQALSYLNLGEVDEVLGRWAEAAVFGTLVLVLVFRPGGLFGHRVLG